MNDKDLKERFENLKRQLDRRDLSSSATQQSLDSLFPILREIYVENRNLHSMVDLGCSYGGLTKLIADFFGNKESVWNRS